MKASQSGSDAHRAAADVWALFWLLQHRDSDPDVGPTRTHLQRLIEAASTPSVIVQAERAPFSKKDMLKARGYSWKPDGPFWHPLMCSKSRPYALHAEVWN